MAGSSAERPRSSSMRRHEPYAGPADRVDEALGDLPAPELVAGRAGSTADFGRVCLPNTMTTANTQISKQTLARAMATRRRLQGGVDSAATRRLVSRTLRSGGAAGDKSSKHGASGGGPGSSGGAAAKNAWSRPLHVAWSPCSDDLVASNLSPRERFRERLFLAMGEIEMTDVLDGARARGAGDGYTGRA